MSRLDRGVLKRPNAGLTVAVILLSLPPSAPAAPIFFGPTPYLSSADSPFDLSGLGTTFFLEDFEDGELNTPGILATDLRVLRPNFDRDSVDGDDSVIDGFGTKGHSAWGGGVCTDSVPPNCWSTAGVLFDANELGQLPTSAGIVWTDGSPLDGVSILVIDALGREIGSSGPFYLGDDSFLGGTAEDRFLGVIDPAGIPGLLLVAGFSPGELGNPFEVDHLQYGLFIPEPATWTSALLGFCGALFCVIRRTRSLPQTSPNAGI